MKTTLLTLIFIAFIGLTAGAQCDYIAATSTATDSLHYTFSGGAIASYGCAPIDPNYWMSGSADSVVVTFVRAQAYPTFRVWGMNDDDSASIKVNGVYYPLTASSASYDVKVVCGQSPGPDGVKFANGKLSGANTNTQGNYSYQDILLNTTNVNTISVHGIAGAGWGFAGVSIDCPQATGKGTR